MRLVWQRQALNDLDRLFDFLASKSRRSEKAIIVGLRMAALPLLSNPRLGERIKGADRIELRRIFVLNYEMRYQVTEDAIRILRIWHTREDR